MQIKEGWLTPAEHQPSVNFNERPKGEISLIVIHNISLPAGHFGNSCVEELFCNQLDSVHPDLKGLNQMKLSSHLYIRRTGEVIQFVPFVKRAWHAGKSEYQGRSDCNDFSIGIELEGTDHSPYREEQYFNLARVCRLLIREYDLDVEAFAGHSDIAPDRKTDPGPAFRWDYFKALMNSEQN